MSLVRLPALDLVKGFVAVGRRMSITQAAEELCVTQSALSKQIRNLEEAIGVRLFHRSHRSVAFTPDGQRLFKIANASVQQLQEAFHMIGARGKRPVTVTASIGVTSLWLLPRLGDFQRRHPDIDVRVAANNAILDLATEDIDLAIRYCAEPNAPPGARRLFGESIAPVASPLLGVGALATAGDLEKHVLLEYEDRRRWLTWSEWLGARELSTRMARGVLMFNQYDQAIQAAVAGQGIAIGRLELLEPLLKERRLEVLGAPDAGRTSHAYWLIQPEESPRAEVRCVADWIQESACPRPTSHSAPT